MDIAIESEGCGDVGRQGRQGRGTLSCEMWRRGHCDRK